MDMLLKHWSSTLCTKKPRLPNISQTLYNSFPRVRLFHASTFKKSITNHSGIVHRTIRPLPKSIGKKTFSRNGFMRRWHPWNLNLGRKWSTHEDDILIRRATMYGWRHWGVIAQGLSKRTSFECLCRWKKLKFLIDWSYTQNIFFSPGDLNLFLKRVMKYGTDWRKVARGIRNKSAIQCENLYYNMQSYLAINEQCAPVGYKKVQRIMKKVGSMGNSLNVIHEHSKWDPEDLEKLKSIVRQQPYYNVIWRIVAKEFPGRTAVQCYKAWHRTWDEMEIQKLREAVAKYGDDWDSISEQVDGRTPLQCRDRWKKMNTEMIRKRPFTQAELQLFLYVMNDPPIRRDHRIDWVHLTGKYFPGRTPSQMLKKWVNICNNPWTKQETEILLQKCKEYEHISDENRKWVEVAKHLLGRKPSECRIRRQICEIKYKNWSLNEYIELFNAVKEHGPKWKVISKILKRRPDMIEKEYKKMQKGDQKLYKFLVKYESTLVKRDV
ncbi:3998_t:CDS:1 [Acaulospora morrowiae]|uniref:3998_t:CDS:1 n=1 Tax=Acaulospora morrowiae TaxID=94023 RepID=A0A9N9B8E2_9GLOM|nr:3998_t:CDS:1 [Acaulospora morrowiae]